MYQIAYQLGAYGSIHRTISRAVRAMLRAQRAAHRGGDLQAITIVRTDDEPLTEAEMLAIEREFVRQGGAS